MVRTKSFPNRQSPPMREHLHRRDSRYEDFSRHGKNKNPLKAIQASGSLKTPRAKKTRTVKAVVGAAADSDSSKSSEEQDDEDDEEEASEDEPEEDAPSRDKKGRKEKAAASKGNGRRKDRSYHNVERRRAGLPKEKLLASPFVSPKRKQELSSVAFDFGSLGEPEEYHTLKLKGKDGHKTPLTTFGNAVASVKRHVRHVSSDPADFNVDLSEDDDYAGVDQVDEIEDDRELTFLEEKYIIDSEETVNTGRRSNRPDDGNVHAGESETGLFSDLPLYGHEDDVLSFPSEAAFVLDSLSHNRKRSNSSSKRVRFEDEVYESETSCTSSEHDSFIFPDIFEQKQATDLSGHHGNTQELDAYRDHILSSDTDGSYWDLYSEGLNDESFAKGGYVESEECSDDSEAGSSGYESDVGDTTDEEDPPPHVDNPNFRLQRQPSTTSASETTATPPPGRSDRKGSRKKGPIMGDFIVDPRKAIFFLDQNRLQVVPPRIPDESGFVTGVSGGSSLNTNSAFPRSFTDGMDIDPMSVLSRMDLMLNGLVGPASKYDNLNGQIVGPPEAFYPFTSIDGDGNIVEDNSDDYGYEDDEDEDTMNINDYIDFSNCEDSEQDPRPDTAGDTEVSESSQPTTDHEQSLPAADSDAFGARKRSSSDLLGHLGQGLVTAFRSNQDKYRRISREPHNPAFRSVIHNAVQMGRAAAADAPISPLRRKRRDSTAFPYSPDSITKRPRIGGHYRSFGDFTSL